MAEREAARRQGFRVHERGCTWRHLSIMCRGVPQEGDEKGAEEWKVQEELMDDVD